MRIAVSSYSFSQYLTSGELTQIGCIKKAKDMGFDGIEFVEIISHDGSAAEEYAARLREECAREQMAVTNFTFAADFLQGSGGDTRKEIERVKRQIDIAEILGASSVRHDATVGYPKVKDGWRGFYTALPVIAEACREVTEYAAKKGIRTMVENHGWFCQDSERVEALINTVAHENFGWLVDIGNFLCVDEIPEKAVGRAARYAFYVHVKDFHFKNGNEPAPGRGFFGTRGGNYLRGAIIGHGIVPVRQCLRLLEQSGYNGDVAIEFEGLEDATLGVGIGLENLRGLITEVYG